MAEDAHQRIADLKSELEPFLKVSKLPDDAKELGECAKVLGNWAKRFNAAIGEHFGEDRQRDYATEAGNSRVNIATAVGRNIYTPKQAVVQEAKFYERYLLILDQLLGPAPRNADED